MEFLTSKTLNIFYSEFVIVLRLMLCFEVKKLKYLHELIFMQLLIIWRKHTLQQDDFPSKLQRCRTTYRLRKNWGKVCLIGS